MNYFELYEMPVSLTIDQKALTKKYFELQKKYHPDYYGQGTAEEQEEALQYSSMINQAFKTFQNKDATIKYLLILKGLLEEEEKYQLPPDFLMEVMELNEMKMDGAAPADIVARAGAMQQEIYAPVAAIIEQYDGAQPDSELLQVKEYYYKKKYLDRLLAE